MELLVRTHSGRQLGLVKGEDIDDIEEKLGLQGVTDLCHASSTRYCFEAYVGPISLSAGWDENNKWVRRVRYNRRRCGIRFAAGHCMLVG